jgi:hypothetical protein
MVAHEAFSMAWVATQFIIQAMLQPALILQQQQQRRHFLQVIPVACLSGST